MTAAANQAVHECAPCYQLRCCERSSAHAHAGTATTAATFICTCRIGAQVDFAVELLVEHVTRLREMSPLWELVQEGVDLNSIQWSQDAH
jgi:cysteine desulfurase